MNQQSISMFSVLNLLPKFNHDYDFLTFDQDQLINSLGNASSSGSETPKSFSLIENIN